MLNKLLDKLFSASGTRTRIIKEYGSASGTLINATATGTTVIIRPTKAAITGLDQSALLKSCNMPDDGWKITALSNQSSPIRTRTLEPASLVRALSGSVYAYNRSPTIDVELSVLANSVDYYNLTILGDLYRELNAPLVDMDVIPASAPGMNITFSKGVMISYDSGFSIQSNARISDKTFVFAFGDVLRPQIEQQQFNSERYSLSDPLSFIGI